MHSGETRIEMAPLHSTSTSTENPDAQQSPATRHGVLRLTVDVPASAPPKHSRPSPPRWRTPEFYVYYLVAAVMLPLMLWIPWQLSSPNSPDYVLFSYKLSPGWLFGRQVDNSDGQYRGFRSNLPALAALVTAFFLGKTVYTHLRQARSTARPNNLVPFYVGAATIAVVILHGSSALKVLTIVLANYALCKVGAGTGGFPALLWAFNGGILFLNEWYHGYQFEQLHPAFAFLDAESLSGAYPRWHVNFNITMLRLISFGMDLHWARTRVDGLIEPGQVPPSKRRPTTLHAEEMYTLMHYIAYTLYPPLYLAGPIITFNDFAWQLRYPLTIPPMTVVRYTGRFIACMLTMEIILHSAHVVAIKDTRAWTHAGPAALGMIGFWNLVIMWLKLLLPWRFFRLWALADGIDPPENMVRCMVNNYSPLGFWRAWHRSFNLWIVRYIYVPLGGAKRAVMSAVVVFTFVALWHDLSWKLLAWGWLAVLFVMPEMAASAVFPASKYGGQGWWRHLCAAGAVLNILMLMIANLVGFVVGVDGTRVLIERLLGTWEGMQFMLLSCGCLWLGAQLMFEYREEELRQGIFRRC